jgi:ATP-dependent exoDNAse (exonuclease V) alpha subunit
VRGRQCRHGRHPLFLTSAADELDELTDASAVSIHRSQEASTRVWSCLTASAWLILQRNPLYTAVTQASRIVVLVGSRRALAKHCSAPNADPAQYHI